MKAINYILLFSFLFLSTYTKAQRDGIDLYMFNPGYFNPAQVALDDIPILSTYYQGFPEFDDLYNFSIDYQQQQQQYKQLNIGYAFRYSFESGFANYHKFALPVNIRLLKYKEAELRFGVSYKFELFSTPVLSQRETDTRTDFDAGLSFKYKKFQIGFSSRNLFQEKFEVPFGFIITNRRIYDINAKVEVALGKNFKTMPSIIWSAYRDSYKFLTFGQHFSYKDFVLVGLLINRTNNRYEKAYYGGFRLFDKLNVLGYYNKEGSLFFKSYTISLQYEFGRKF